MGEEESIPLDKAGLVRVAGTVGRRDAAVERTWRFPQPSGSPRPVPKRDERNKGQTGTQMEPSEQGKRPEQCNYAGLRALHHLMLRQVGNSDFV